MKQLKRICSLVLISIFLTACGQVFTVFRTAVAASTPFVNRLVREGKITQVKADAIKKDLGDIINASEQWDREFKAATTVAEKATAFQNAAAGYASVIARGNFANVPWLDEAVGIMNDIFDTIRIFYGPKGGSPKAGTPRSEKDLKSYVEGQSKRLKESFK